MILFSVLSAFIPSLDTAGMYQRFRAIRPGRKILSAATALLLVFGPTIPARAQWAVTDPGAWIQRAMQYIKDNYQAVYVNSTDATHFLQQAAMTYQDYKQARALYQRVTDGNIVLSLVDSLPVIDADDGSGTKTIIRPVFRQQDRMNAPQVNVSVQTPNWSSMLKNLDFDVSTVRTPAADAKKTPQQIQADSLSDGWLSWQLAQQQAQVEQPYWNIQVPTPQADPYAPLRAEIKQHYQQIGQALQTASENARQLYGEGSTQYQESLQALTDFQQALQSGADEQTGQSLEQALEGIDAEAQVVIGKYASARNEMGMTIKNEAAKDQNIQQVYSNYAQTQNNWKPFSLFDFIDGKTPEPPKGQDQGNAVQQNIQEEAIATTANQQFKYALTNDLRDAQGQLMTYANKKQEAIGYVRGRLASRIARAQGSVVIAEMARLQKIADSIQISAALPDGAHLIVPASISNSLPGSVPAGSPAATEAVQSDIANAATKNATLAERILTEQVHQNATGMAWDIARPVLQGLDAGANKLFGHSFNLTQWASKA